MFEEMESAKKLIMSKDRILLLTHQRMDADGLSGILILWTILWRLGKDVKILSSEPVPEVYSFLPFIEKVSNSADSSRDFTISIKKWAWVEIEKIKYDSDDNYLNIYISPKTWKIDEKDVSYSRWLWKFDLIFVVDTWDLDHLWTLYQNNIELFYNTPVINIDHHVTNTWFWQVNLVSTTASSSTEIIFELIKYFSDNWREMIDEDIATLLMTWLITDTWSFRHNNTSPRSLELAADLMDMGARQQEIIKHIYKTKQLSTLKIWWRILSKIQEDPIHRIVWSTVTKQDFKDTWCTPENTDEIIDELLSNAPWAEIIMLFKDCLNWILSVSIRTTSITIDWSQISRHFWWWGHKQAAGFKIKRFTNFDAEVWNVLKYVQEFQRERLWILKDENTWYKWVNEIEHHDHKKAKNDNNSWKKKEVESGIVFPLSRDKWKKWIGIKDLLKGDSAKAEDGGKHTYSQENRANQITSSKPEVKLETSAKNVTEQKGAEKEIITQQKDENLALEPSVQLSEPGNQVTTANLEPTTDYIAPKEVQSSATVITHKDDPVAEVNSLPEAVTQADIVPESTEEKESNNIEQMASDFLWAEPVVINQWSQGGTVDDLLNDLEVNDSIDDDIILDDDIDSGNDLADSSDFGMDLDEEKTVSLNNDYNEPVNQFSGSSIWNQAWTNAYQNDSMVTQADADKYARKFYDLLSTVSIESPEYRKYYDWYIYYARIAWWQV